MKASFFHFLSTIVFLCPMVFGQRPLMSAADINTSATGLHRSPQEAEILRKIYSDQQRESEFDRLQNIADTAQLTRGAVIIRKDFSRVTSMFTKPTNDENAVYQQFLKQRDTGIFTFLNPKSCARPTANQESSKKGANDCPQQMIPGRGTQFSFRKKDYTFLDWSDLGLKENWFFSTAPAVQTILVDIGDVALANVSVDSEDLSYLTDFVPAATLEGADRQHAELENGITRNGRTFFNVVLAANYHTYVLRSIAYRGQLFTVLNPGGHKIKIDILAGDQRNDVIVAFRVIGTDQNGNLRILWRRLRAVESPKLDLPVSKVDKPNAGLWIN